MRDAVASYGIHEYPPITCNCDVCGRECSSDEILFEIDPNGKWACEDCFEEYCKDNLDIYEMARLWHIRKEKGYYLGE